VSASATASLSSQSSARRARPLLILDAGGVLVTEPIPRLLRALAAKSPLPYEELARRYERNLYYDLWRGRLSERDFWPALAEQAGIDGPVGAWREFFLYSLRPLPALRHVPVWAEEADVFVLSNHLPQWLEPVLVRAGVRDHVSGLFISSQIGHVKPEREAFECVLRAKPAACTDILLVDDNARNIEAARDLGMDTLLADEAGAWCSDAERWLRTRSR
jgi:FMN phosphatase YigB (HAD superfamily)